MAGPKPMMSLPLIVDLKVVISLLPYAYFDWKGEGAFIMPIFCNCSACFLTDHIWKFKILGHIWREEVEV